MKYQRGSNLKDGYWIGYIHIPRSYRAGDVRLLWKIAQDLHFIPIIDRIRTCLHVL